MLDLDSDKWETIRHCYGTAGNIPRLLRDLEQFPEEDSYQAEPWFTLWSSLCHQGDVYTASYAAVPHIVRLLHSDPQRATISFFLLPAAVEIARRTEKGSKLPEELSVAYHEALSRMVEAASCALQPDRSEDYCLSVAAAIAAAKGHVLLARVLMELNSQTRAEFLKSLD